MLNLFNSKHLLEKKLMLALDLSAYVRTVYLTTILNILGHDSNGIKRTRIAYHSPSR